VQPAVTIGTTAGVAEVIATSSSNVAAFDVQGTLTLGLLSGNTGRLELHGVDWASPSSATIGNGGAGILVLQGSNGIPAQMTNSSATVGNLDGSLGSANVNDGAFWDLSSTLQVGNRGTGIVNINESGRIRNAGDGIVGAEVGSSGTLILHHPDADWENLANLYIGGNTSAAGGNGQLTIDAGTVRVASNMTVWSRGEVEINGTYPAGAFGHLDLNGILTLDSSSHLSLAGGKLSIADATAFRPPAGSFTWSTGELNVKSGDVIVGNATNPQALLGPNVTLNAGMILDVANNITLGSAGAAQLTINDGSAVASDGAVIGGRDSVSVTINSGVLRVHDELLVGGERGPGATQIVVTSGGALYNESAHVAPVGVTAVNPALYATIRLEAAEWHSSGGVFLGWSDAGDYSRGGAGSLAITSGSTFRADGGLSIGRNFDVTLDGGTIVTGMSADSTVLGSIAVSGAGSNTWKFDHPVYPVGPLPPPNLLTIDGGAVDLGANGLLETHSVPVTIDIKAGGTLTSKVKGDYTTHVKLASSRSTWTTPGPLIIDGAESAFGIGKIGALTLSSGTTVNVGGAVGVTDTGVLTLGGGTLNATTFSTDTLDIADFGTINAKFSTPGNVTATGNLTIGDPLSYTGVQIGGELFVGPHTVTINTRGFFNIGTLTQITGGTLVAPGGASIPSGNALTAFGAIHGRVFSQGGSTIEATGSLTLGDAAALDGFFSDGAFVVGNHTVTLHDANEVVLGSLTTLGDSTVVGALHGTLNAANGALVDFGKNLVGYGTLATPNDATRPVLNNGSIAGNSAAEPITLSGFVKGVGRFDHVVFSGTFSPGFSPATVQLGSAAYGDAAALVLELGGPTPGTQHDQLIHSGVASLAGTLEIDLLGDFTPAAEHSFVLMTYGSHTGEFDSLSLPPLPTGLTWSLDYDVTQLTLSVVPSLLPGDIDLDGDVDGLDAARFTPHLGVLGGAVWTTGDFDGDGTTTLEDLVLLQANLGVTTPSPATVPEPRCFWLVGGAGLALLRFFRKPRPMRDSVAS
jgi:T5SS/PEP-CTERM-associated repeat protein